MAGADVMVMFDGWPYPCKVNLPLKAYVLLRDAFVQLVPPERKHVVSNYSLQCDGAVVDPYEEITGNERTFVLHFKESTAVSHVPSSCAGKLSPIASHDTLNVVAPAKSQGPALEEATDISKDIESKVVIGLPRAAKPASRERRFARLAAVERLLGFNETATTMGINIRCSKTNSSAIRCFPPAELLCEFVSTNPAVTLNVFHSNIVDPDTGHCRLQLLCLDAQGLKRQRTNSNSIHHFVQQTMTALALTTSAHRIKRLRRFYEQGNAGADTSDTIDFSFLGPDDALLTLRGIMFVLEVKRVEDGTANQSSNLADGVSQVIRRLVKILESRNGASTAIGAATNGLTIIFVRVSSNPYEDAAPTETASEDALPEYPSPYILERTDALQLTVSTSAAKPRVSPRGAPDNPKCFGPSTDVAGDVAVRSSAPTAPVPLSPHAAPGCHGIPPGLVYLYWVLTGVEAVVNHSPATSLPPLSLLRDTRWAAYHKVESFGKGGFANIALLQHPARNESYVLKTMRMDSPHDAMPHELRMLEKLKDVPNVIKLEDSVYDSSAKLRGLVLTPVGQPVLDLAVAYIPNMVFDVLTALNYAHGLAPGLAHCDVRPTNIIFVPAEDKFYLIDRGLGAVVGHEQTELVGADAFLRDDILQNVKADICTPYEVRKCHDFASLAYCVVSVHSCHDGGLPWPSYALTADQQLAERAKCMAAWRSTAPVELTAIVDTLLGLVDTDPLLCFKLEALMQSLRDQRKEHHDLGSST